MVDFKNFWFLNYVFKEFYTVVFSNKFQDNFIVLTQKAILRHKVY